MELSLVFVNDVHGYVEPHTELFYDGEHEITATAGGYPALAAKINTIRKECPATVVFDGGDTFHGTLPMVQSKGEALLPILNYIGFDAMVGHWDFAYGPQQLKNLAGQLTYPVLGINVYNEDGTLFLQPYCILEVAEVKFAVIGICSNIIDKTMPARFSRGIRITDGIQELPGYVQQVRDAGADIVILLSHNGFPQDVEIVKAVAGIDICLSAHTHNRLYAPVLAGDTIIIQCGCHGSFLGHLKLTIENKKIQKQLYNLITITGDIEPDAAVQGMVDDIMKPYRALQDEVVGKTEMILHRYNTLNSTMDDLLLRAIARVAQVNIAFSNGWRYGAPIAKGDISKWDLFNIIPMNPVVSTVELTGLEIIKMLEENLERTFSPQPMKQMGGYVKRALGLQVKMRIENPAGNRIQQIFADGEPLQNKKLYKVAFVTSQGVPEKLGKNRADLAMTAVEAMVSYMQENLTVKAFEPRTFSLV